MVDVPSVPRPPPKPPADPAAGSTFGFCVVGGACMSGNDNYSFLPADPFPELNYDKLAAQMMVLLIKRIDSDKHKWDFLMIPRGRRGFGKKELLHYIGFILKTVTEANGGLPPYSIAKDFHGSHVWISQCIQGLLDRSHLSDVAFFKDCNWKLDSNHIPCWPFNTMEYKQQHPVFDCGDPWHIQKSVVENCFRSGLRTISMFGFHVTIIGLIPGGSTRDITG